MALQTIKDLQNALKTSSNVIQPEVKDTTYQKKLNYFTQNSENLYKKYGSTEYNRYLKYYTTKANAEKYGIDQNTIAPSYAKIDDLINNREKYESQYGKSGYNTYYSSTYNLNKDEINTLNDAIALKEKGSYSADLLTDEMKTKFKYTDDKEDILRQKLGYVPKSFNSYAKKLVADAKKASMTDEEIEAELTAKQNASYWDSIDTGEEETITEQQVKDAINILNGVAVVDPKATPLSVVSNKAAETSELTSAQATEDTEQDAKVKKLEQEIKELEIQKMKANRESYSSSDNSAFMQAKANYDTKVAELATLRKSYTDNKKAKEQAYYSDLKNTDDFTKYVAKGEEKGGFLEDVKNLLPSIDNIEHQKALEQITDEEKATYYYLLGKEGEESSKKYLKSIMEGLNARYGSKVAEIVPDNLLSAMAYSSKAGLDQFVQGTSQLFTSEALPTSGTQYASSQIREGLGGVGKVIYDIGTTSANMMPSILLSSLTGGAGSLLGSATLGASAGGTAYNQALKQGYTEEQARSYGIMTGALEGGLQYLLGGIGKLGGKISSKVAAKAISKIDNVALKVAADFGTSALSEAGEEYLQEILTPIVRNETLDENNEFKPFTEEALYSAMMGALTSGVFKGADILSNQVSQNNTENTKTIEPNLEQIKQPKEQQVVSSNTEQTEQPQQQLEQLKFEETTKPIEQQTVANNTEQQSSPFVKTNVRKGAQTMANVAAGTEIGAKLQEDIYDGVYGYTPESSKTDVIEALKEVKANPTGLLSVTDILDRNQEIKRYGKKDVALADALWIDALERNDKQAADHYAAISADMKTIAGQTVQTGANISRLTPEGFVIFAQRQLARMNAEGKIKFGEKWADVGFTEEEQTAILKAPDADAREVELQKAMSRIHKELPSTNWDKFDQVHKIFMLSNPATLIRNFGGNAINRSVEAVSKKVEGLLQLTLSKEKRTVPLKLKQEYRDMVNGAWENGGKQLFQSQGKYELTNKGTSSFTPVIKDKGIIGKSYNAYAKFIVEKMESGDTYFAKPAYETALARYLQARGLEKITPEATKYAMQEALEVTYRDFSKFADAWVKFQKSNVIGKVSTFVTPFVKTPTNIARRAFEYSEAGLLKTLTLDTAKLKKGKITADQYIKSLSRGITGTVGLTGLGYLLGSGILPFAQLTAGWSDNKKEKELQQLEGFQPYSLKIGDTYFSVAWAQPAITPVIVGAQIAQSVKDKTSILQSVDPIKGIEYLADALGDLTVFSGLKGAVSYSSGLWDSLGNIAVSGASQMIPSVVKKVAQTFDKTKYDIYNGSIPQQIAQQSITSIPGAKELLKIIGIDADIAPQVDPFGNKKSLSDNILVRAALNFFSPTNVTTTLNDPVMKEINRLFNEIENTRSDLTATDILPTVFSDTYIKDTAISNENINISKTERAKLKEKTGQSIYRILGAYMNSPIYKIDDLETKVTKIKKIYKEMWTATKANLIKSKIPSVPKIK